MASLKANEIDRSEITEIPVGFDPRILIEGKIDILAVFNSNEPDTIRTLGFDVDVWTSADFGVPGMGLTYVTTQELVNNDPLNGGWMLKIKVSDIQEINNLMTEEEYKNYIQQL